MWEYFFKEYNDDYKAISLVCSLCKIHYKPSNTSDTLAKHIKKKHSDKYEKQQSTLENFTSKPYSKQSK